MKIAVVILNWNGRDLLERFLPSVVKNSPEANIYVADNASTDESVAYLESDFPEVRIIQNKENGGYAKGYNDALKNLTEDVFILLNSDVEVASDWLKPIRKHFEENPRTGIVQPKIRDYRKKAYFEYAGAAGGYIDQLGYPFCRGRIFDALEKDEGQYDSVTSIFWASGAALAIRRSLYEELEGLDEAYFAHQEEIDLCWRAFNAGYQTVFVPQSVVYHLGGATLNNLNPRKTYLNFRNSLFNLLKNVPGNQVYFLIFIRLILDGIAGVKFLFEGKPKHTWAVAQAHFHFYAKFKYLHAKRRTPYNKGKYWEFKSIVWNYFVLGKKKYTDLPK